MGPSMKYLAMLLLNIPICISFVMTEDLAIPIVIDSGSFKRKPASQETKFLTRYLQAFSGVIPNRGQFIGMMANRRLAGQEAIVYKSFLGLTHPIEHGIVTNWDCIEILLQHTFSQELDVATENHPLLITESPLNTNINREKMIQFMFEYFKTPALYLSNNQTLALHSQGRTTGIVVDSGYLSTHLVSIYKGHVVKPLVTRLDIGGSDITRNLCKILSERGYSFGHETRIDVYQDMKDKLSYISMDVENALSLTEQTHTYKLLAGQEITIGNERFRSPEIIFQPSLIGCEQDGIHIATNNLIMKNDTQLRKYLYNNILLVGGNTMITGMSNRLYKEISQLTPDVPINVKAPPDRKFSSWIGGSLLASMSNFVKMSISYFIQ